MGALTLNFAKVAELYGLAHSTLLHYETEGLIAPLRVETERYYTARDCTRIELALKGKKLGFSLGEVKRLIAAHLPEPLERRGNAQLNQRMAQLEFEKLEIQAAIERLAAKIKQGEA